MSRGFQSVGLRRPGQPGCWQGRCACHFLARFQRSSWQGPGVKGGNTTGMPVMLSNAAPGPGVCSAYLAPELAQLPAVEATPGTPTAVCTMGVQCECNSQVHPPTPGGRQLRTANSHMPCLERSLRRATSGAANCSKEHDMGTTLPVYCGRYPLSDASLTLSSALRDPDFRSSVRVPSFAYPFNGCSQVQ